MPSFHNRRTLEALSTRLARRSIAKAHHCRAEKMSATLARTPGNFCFLSRTAIVNESDSPVALVGRGCNRPIGRALALPVPVSVSPSQQYRTLSIALAALRAAGLLPHSALVFSGRGNTSI